MRFKNLKIHVVKTRKNLNGFRSLEDNLGSGTTTTTTSSMQVDGEDEEEEDEEMEIPDDVEEIVEFLLTCLKDRETIVRWSAAKGVGRVTGRLPREFADQVSLIVSHLLC